MAFSSRQKIGPWTWHSPVSFLEDNNLELSPNYHSPALGLDLYSSCMGIEYIHHQIGAGSLLSYCVQDKNKQKNGQDRRFRGGISNSWTWGLCRRSHGILEVRLEVSQNVDFSFPAARAKKKAIKGEQYLVATPCSLRNSTLRLPSWPCIISTLTTWMQVRGRWERSLPWPW